MKLDIYSRRSMTSRCVVVCLLAGLFSQSFAEDPVQLSPYLKKSTTFHFESLDTDVPLSFYYITNSTHSRPYDIGSPVLVYVKNHRHERIGMEPDSSILMDYLRQRYIVVTLDFKGNEKAVSPRFDKDMHHLFKALYGYETPSLFDGFNLTPRKYRCFFVPAGCRVATDLVYWEIDKHGANGTLDYMVGFYNDIIADVVTGKGKISKQEEMMDRQGRPMQYKLAMDIIYPSMPKKRVPLVLYTSTQVTRHPHVSPSTYRPHTIGLLMRGYSYAIIDHCYNPLRRHYWYLQKYSLDEWNGVAAYTAAIRFLRSHADTYGIDDRYIGAIGHSKGAYSSGLLATPDHENLSERLTFGNFPEGSPESQPWPGFSSNIAVSYQSPGLRTWLVTKENIPTFVCMGANDHLMENHKETFLQQAKVLEEADISHVALFMEDKGHELPYGYDDKLGIDRYELFQTFFDQYLKVEEKLPPVVLMMAPRQNEVDVDPTASISIHFAPFMNEKSVSDGQGVKLLRLKTGDSIQGEWKSCQQCTKFEFTPSHKLEKYEKYRIVVTTHVINKAGTRLAKELVSDFYVAE